MRPPAKSGGGGNDLIEVTSLSAIDHVLTHKPSRIRGLVIQSPPTALRARVTDLQAKAKAAGISVQFGEPPASGRRGEPGNEPVIAWLAPFQYTPFNDFLASVESKPRATVLALDHLQDPQNFGALCRSAEAFGASAIILPKDRSVTVTSGVYSASVGAVETLPIVLVANLGESLRRLKEANFWIVGSSLGDGAKPPWETPDFEKIALVMGAELEGMSKLVSELCDWKIEIPLQGKVQSLNVSNAGATLLYEFFRRGLAPKGK